MTEIIEVDSSGMELVLDALDLDVEDLECIICGDGVSLDPLDFGLFPKERIVHSNLICLSKYVIKY